MQHPFIHPYAYSILILLFTMITATAVFILLLLLLYYCHYYKTVATDILLRASLFPGAADLKNQPSKLIFILWLPCVASINLGYTTLEDCCDPLYLWVISLSGLYNTFLRIFRKNIAPEHGNLDAIRGGLINLLVYTHRLKEANDDGEDMDDYEPLDVMDFIFHEIKHCIGERHIPIYAPYVMMLLINKADVSPTDGCVPHKFSYIQNKLTSIQRFGDPSSRCTKSAYAAEGQTSRVGSSRSYFPE